MGCDDFDPNDLPGGCLQHGDPCRFRIQSSSRGRNFAKLGDEQARDRVLFITFFEGKIKLVVQFINANMSKNYGDARFGLQNVLL